MFLKNPFTLALVILVYTMINSVDLFFTWMEASSEQYSWIVFLFWVTPVLWCRVFPTIEKERYYHPALLWLAVGFSFLGEIVSMNMLKYIGFVFSIASFAPFQLWMIPWLCSSVAWMPVFGWLGNLYFSSMVQILRFAVVIAGLGRFFWMQRGSQRIDTETQRHKDV